MADDAAAGQHPVGGHDHVRPRRALDRLRRLDVVASRSGSGSRAAWRRRAAARPSPRRSSRGDGGRCRTPSTPSASRGRAAAAGSRPRSISRSSSQTTSWVRPIANDGTSRTPFAVGDHPDRLGQDADRLVLGLVLAAAVGRLDEDVVGVVMRSSGRAGSASRAGRGRRSRR